MIQDSDYVALRKGLLRFLVLAIVSSHEVYASDILRRLAPTAFATQEGTLYPLLSKMRREGLLDHEWRESESGPPRKYYQLTPIGLSQLAEFHEYWADTATFIDELEKTEWNG